MLSLASNHLWRQFAPTQHNEMGPARADGAASGEQEAQTLTAGADAPQERSGFRFERGQCVAGRFRVVRALGYGGMGEVYEVHDGELREFVALKVHRASSATAVARLKAEVRLARRVVHPNVCRVHELGRHLAKDGDFTYFLTMELLAGESLSRRIRRTGPLPVAQALAIGERLASGLEAIHEEQVVHGDVKSDNIMIRPDDASTGLTPVLLDFGAATALDSTDDSRGTTPIIGTPDYMAPELFESGPHSPASDLYALGLVLFKLLAGRLPFETGTSLGRIVQRLTGRALNPSSFVSSVPREVDKVVSWCLCREPSERPPSAAQLRLALKTAHSAVRYAS